MPTKKQTASLEALLKRIRDRWRYANDEWREIRREGAIDMRFISGDPWNASDRLQREDANRPCTSADQINQYCNQVINDVRQNRRAIKVSPEGAATTDRSAETLANWVRHIEYASRAQLVYASTFENAVQRSYGYHRIQPVYPSERAPRQELRILPFPNPDLVTPDPDFQMPDGRDMRYCFVQEWTDKIAFKKQYGEDAIRTNMEDQHAVDWDKDDKILKCEYWEIDETDDELLLFQGPQGEEVALFLSELKENEAIQLRPIGKREATRKTCTQYVTNGFAILGAPVTFPIPAIPIVPCFGKILYRDPYGAGEKGTDPSGTKRQIMSLVRLARDPQMSLAYCRTLQLEILGQIPKAPVVGYEGQFTNHESAWQKAPHEPIAFLEIKATTTETGPNTVLPHPQRIDYNPGQYLQSAELVAESMRRDIQSAMGISPQFTATQRRGEKSGIAIERLEAQAQRGSFHFIANYDAAIERTGELLVQLYPFYHQGAQTIVVRQPNDTVSRQPVTDEPQPEETSDGPVYIPKDGHGVTLSVGPPSNSEREAASDFADLLIGNPQAFPFIAPLVTKLKNLGPVGDEIAQALEMMQPPAVRAALSEEKLKKLPQEARAIIGQMMQQMEQMKQVAEGAHQVIETKKVEQQGEMEVKNLEFKHDLALQQMKFEHEIALAELKAQFDLKKALLTQKPETPGPDPSVPLLTMGLEHQHEAAEAAKDRQHEKDMAGMQAQIAREQADQQMAQQVAADSFARNEEAELNPPQPEAGA